MSRDGTPATSGGPVDPPSGRRGVGDGTWADWYQMAMQESGARISEPQGPPYLIGMAQVRQEAVGQIYGRVAGKEPPAHNIASEALRAYYTRVDPPTLNTWACQILCMIVEYHMACMTRGSPVTSPLVPGELEEHLPPLTSYAPPKDRSGVTDVLVRDHWARTLRVAVWCHCLDMALSEPTSSGSLVRSCHRMGHLLAYFLGPGTAWGLQFEDVVTQVLKENWWQLKTRHTNAASSLRRCNKRRTTLCTEIDATSEAREMVTDPPSSQELEARLSTLQTSLSAIERAITRYEDLIKDCQIQEEEEARQEEISHEQSEEEISNAEMINDEECGGPEPSGPCEEADTEDPPPLDPIEDAGPTPSAPAGDAVSPEEDASLMQPAPQPGDPVAGSHSPRSEAGMVSGEMAELSLASPSQPEPAEGETPP